MEFQKEDEALKKRMCTIVIVVAVALLGLLPTVLAESETDTAGNTFSGTSQESGIQIEKDYFWTGQSLTLKNASIGADAFIIGQSINISGTTTGGSIRAAGQNIVIENATAGANITVAGYGIELGAGTKASGIYAAGNNITLDGECRGGQFYGERVVINGEIKGDALISAEKVSLGPNAKVTGTLRVEAPQKPEIAATAVVGDLQYTKPQTETATAKPSVGSVIARRVSATGYWLVANLAIAALLCLVLSRGLEDAKSMMVNRPIPLWVSGLVALLSLPLCLILLCITFIGLPIVGILALFTAAVGMISIAFAGASLGRLVLPKWNIWGASLLGAGVLSLVKIIPFISGLVSFAAMMYTFGWLVQVVWRQMKSQPEVQE